MQQTRGDGIGVIRVLVFGGAIYQLVLGWFLLLLLVGSVGWADSAYEMWDDGEPRGRLDEIVLARLEEAGLEKAALCSDEVFLRRVYLDLTGTIPNAGEMWRFWQDKSEDKRERVIDELMTRESFADYWTLKWCDVLRVKAEFPINLWPNGVQAYYRWIHESIKANKTYDVFVRELLTSSGSNFREPPVNFYLAMQGKDAGAIARSVGLTFMGVRVEQWEDKQREEMEKFFSRVHFKGTAEWKETIVMNYPGIKEGEAGRLVAALPSGVEVVVEGGDDPRKVFADWLIDANNEWFARAVVNRMWAWIVGRGMIGEPDDMDIRDLGPHQELMDYLADELIASGWNLRHVIKLICNSRTYQQSSIPNSDYRRSVEMFACYPVTRLDAEVLSDVFVSLFGGRESYMSMVPEPFTFVPEEHRSVELQDGSISNQFLEMFGRPARDTGTMNERQNSPTRAQKLHLLNSSKVQGRIQSSWRVKGWIKSSKGNSNRLITTIYINVLGRRPNASEMVRSQLHLGDDRKKRNDRTVDLVWALVNTKEFLYKH